MNSLPGGMVGVDEDTTVGVRPEKLPLERRGDRDPHIQARLELVEYLGSGALLHCSAADVKLVVETHGDGKPRPKPGCTIDLFTDSDSRQRYPASEGGARSGRTSYGRNTTTPASNRPPPFRVTDHFLTRT